MKNIICIYHYYTYKKYQNFYVEFKKEISNDDLTKIIYLSDLIYCYMPEFNSIDDALGEEQMEEILSDVFSFKVLNREENIDSEAEENFDIYSIAENFTNKTKGFENLYDTFKGKEILDCLFTNFSKNLKSKTDLERLKKIEIGLKKQSLDNFPVWDSLMEKNITPNSFYNLINI